MAIVPCKPGPSGTTYNTDQHWVKYYPPEERTYTKPSPAFHCVGVDLGNLNDFTSITVLEVQRGYEILQIVPYNAARQEISRKPYLNFIVRIVHRPKLNIGYEKIVDQVEAIVEDLYGVQAKWAYEENNSFRRPIVVFDRTGLGNPVCEAARKRKILQSAIGISITGGNTASMTGRDWTAPKAFMLGELRLAMSQKRLQVAQGFRDREVLQEELQNFQARISPSGRASFEAASDGHDDTVLSLALAVTAAKAQFANLASTVPFAPGVGFLPR
jgi:hypothetical protein